MLSEADIIKLVFGFKLRHLRQERGLPLEELARRSGLSKSYLHDLEKGKKYPKVDKIQDLARGLEVEYDYLVSRRASKKIQPVLDLFNAAFIKDFPLEQFGLQPEKLVELLVNSPDKINAFVSTIMSITRQYQVQRGHLYLTALRAYQDLHDNYFPDLEAGVRACREQHQLPYEQDLSVQALETCLHSAYGVRTDRQALGRYPNLREFRSYFSAARHTLYLRPGLSSAQERFLLARELGFQFFGWPERPYLTRIHEISSFDTLFNNFRASYFASALLMDEARLSADFKHWASRPVWDGSLWLEWLSRYEVTPEMLMQRLTNILPRHFDMGDLFFIRLEAEPDLKRYDMTKELHLSRLHNPYATALGEHYCRRWVSVNIIKQARQRLSAAAAPAILVDAQVSRYWGTPNEYFCLSMAVSQPGSGRPLSSVTLGLLVNDRLRALLRCLGDASVPVRTVNTTCERCSVPDCEARVAPPLMLEREQQAALILQQLDALERDDQ